MRTSLLPVIAALLLVGCRSSPLPIDGDVTDLGNGDLGSARDVGTMDLPAARDLAPAGLSCAQIIDCANNATTQTAFNKCISSGSPTGRMLFAAVDQCITNECGSLGQGGGGNSPCDTIETCVSCVSTGMGQTSSNGVCEAVQGGGTVTDPKCGRCVDPLLACENDK